jgi:hypothetical protein
MSTVPAALEALIAATQAALPDVQVHDGQPVGDLADDLVVIGWSAERPSVSVDLSRESAGVDDREAYDIACLLSSFSGETVTKPVRDRVFALYDTLVAELRRDQSLGETVMRARPRVVDFDQVQIDGGEESASGASATITFVVTCDAFDY